MKKGFTLAEVLITLGIIGVVAALTLPSLIQNYQKQVWVNQLKKTISVLENGFKKAMADDEVDKLQDTELWQSANNCGGSVSNANCNEFFNNFQKYFKVTYSPTQTYRQFTGLNNNNVAMSCTTDINLPSGATFGFYLSISKTVGSGGFGPHGVLTVIAIDVNGDKKPNKVGRDLFFIGVTEKGQLIPHGTEAANRLQCESVTTSAQMEACMASMASYSWDNGWASCTEEGNGFYCMARIMAKGWKMDY